MNTINRLKVRVGTMQGINMKLLENDSKSIRFKVYANTKNEDISKHMEHNRVFANIDILKDVKMSCMHYPNKTREVTIRDKFVRPCSSITGKISFDRKYNITMKR